MNPTPPPDVFAEALALFTPQRLLHDPRATGEGVTVCLWTAASSGLLEEKFRQQGAELYPIQGGVFSADQPEPLPYNGRQSAPMARPSPTSS